MKDKLFKIFSSNIKIRVSGKNTNNFIKRLIRNKINIIKVIPISYKEIDIIIDYNDLEEVLKYKTIYQVKVKAYYGKLKMLRIINKNKYLFLFLIIGLIAITILSNVIFKVEIIHSNNKLIKTLTEELSSYGIKKYSFIKSYEKIENIEKEILKNNKDKIEWLEIIRNGTKYIVRVEERIINKNNNDNKIYEIIARKNAIIKRIDAESGEKIRSIDTYIKKGDVVISPNIIKPNNDVAVASAYGKVLGEVWYNVSIDFPYHYHEVKYTGNKKKVLVLNIINKRIPFFDFNEYKSFNKDIKYIFNDNLFPFNLALEYQYETNIIDKNYNYNEAVTAATEKVKEKLKEKYKTIEDITKIIINGESNNKNSISLNLFVATLEDITEYREVINESSDT